MGGQDQPRELTALPDAPGVYYLLSPDDELLYVGKATSIRKRIQQHRRAGTGAIVNTADIRWETTGDESEAAAREADVIVSLRPRFNKAISAQGKWVYIVVDDTGLTLSPQSGGGRTYGCFPHLGVGVSSRPGIECSEGYAGLARLLWAALGDGDRFPAAMSGPSPPARVDLALPAAMRSPLHRFLSGTSPAVLDQLAQSAADRREAYMQPALRRDRSAAAAFFGAGPAALRALRLRHHLPAGPLDRATIEGLVADAVRAVTGNFHIRASRARAREAQLSALLPPSPHPFGADQDR